jgi:hypothetical protein
MKVPGTFDGRRYEDLRVLIPTVIANHYRACNEWDDVAKVRFQFPVSSTGKDIVIVWVRRGFIPNGGHHDCCERWVLGPTGEVESTTAAGRPAQSPWALPPKLTLEEQNQRAADFRRQQSERRARAKQEADERYVKGFTEHVERQSNRTPRKKSKPCLMCSTPALDGEDYCEVHAK